MKRREFPALGRELTRRAAVWKDRNGADEEKLCHEHKSKTCSRPWGERKKTTTEEIKEGSTIGILLRRSRTPRRKRRANDIPKVDSLPIKGDRKDSSVGGGEGPEGRGGHPYCGRGG